MHSVENAFKIEGKAVDLITIRNKNDLWVKLINYGAAITEILVPDKDGRIENIVLTYEDVEDYITNSAYFGATIGRTSGRIGNGQFILDDKIYELNRNYGVNHGHGGPKGFSFKVWDYKIKEDDDKIQVEFTYLSKDMDENYPGNLQVKVRYTLKNTNELIIEYEGETDKKTLCNLTNHSYFNLSGDYKRKVTDQYLKISSKSFLELDSNNIPTGKFINVYGTPMDFNDFKTIGRDIYKSYEQLNMTGGYDHTWMLDKENNQIEMQDKISGRKMTISTTYPSVVVYSYNFPNNERLKSGRIGRKHDGICFETQYEPNGINNGKLNSAILDIEKKYYERTELKFSIGEEI